MLHERDEHVIAFEAVAETAELRDWLHNARIREVERVIQEESPPKRGEQGPTLLAVLTVVLGF
jgi:hypothetical protein